MDKKMILEQARAKLTKTYGQGVVFQMGHDEIIPVKAATTGAVTLDRALGIGGLPHGRISELYGPEASGKTTLALSVIAGVQAKGGTAAIVDVEHALDFAYAETLGVDIANLLVSQPDSGEQALDVIETLVRAGVDVVVLDSVAMLIPQAEIDGEMNSFQIGAQARLMSKAMRKLAAPVHVSGTALIFVNQIRTNIGGYGNPEVTSGGRALKFAASVRVELRRKETIRDGDQNIGIVITAKVQKNKLAKPFNSCEFSLFFGTGIDYVGTLAAAAVAHGFITRSGAWYALDGQSLQGMEKVREYLREDKDAQARLEALVNPPSETSQHAAI